MFSRRAGRDAWRPVSPCETIIKVQGYPNERGTISSVQRNQYVPAVLAGEVQRDAAL